MSETLRILVIDDDEIDRMAVRRALADAEVDAEIVETGTGAEGRLMLRHDRFDCALVDNLLPDLNGLALLNLIKADGVATPVIIMTGQGNEQLVVELMKAGAVDYLSKSRTSLDHLARSVRNAVRVHRAEQAAAAITEELHEQTRVAQALNRIGTRLAEERDLQRLVQLVTDEATTLCGAEFGAFFYNVLNERGESYTLYTLSGVPREAFARFPMPRNTHIFGPTFRGEGVVRLADVTADPRYGQNAPHAGMPAGHLPVKSYLAVPVTSRSGEVIGGLFFGHARPAMFAEREERLVVGIANQAAVAIDNVRLVEALRRGEERYRFLAESVPQIVWTAQPDGKLDYFNRAWFAYSGQTYETARGDGWASAVHPDDLERTLMRWQEALARGDKYEHQFRLRRADGEYRWHIVRALPMRDEANGQIVKWFGACTDLHDWRLTQEALRIQRERLDLVMDASELGLWYCDLPFDKLVWNAKCKEHFHLPPDAEVTFETFNERIHPADRERTHRAIREAIEARKGYDIDYRTVSADGKVNWIRAIGRAFFNSEGKPVRFDGITVDVTGQKEAEQTLRQAKEAAEAANNAKDRFLAVLSHELRTPLMPVLTTVQSMELEGGLSDELRDALAVIRRNVELEARLIDDLLDLTRISKGKLQLNFEPVDLHAVIRSAFDICAVDVVGKRLGTTLDLTAARHHVSGDPARLQQVFWNLIKNAVKFTPHGGHITVHSWDDAGGATMVRVTDTGIGIEADALSRIFDAFEQADDTVARQFGGLGLGLAISKALIDLHGGNLSAESGGAGRGASFTLELRPVASDGTRAAEEGGAGGAAAAAAAMIEQKRADIRILLVDDHHDTNRAMARLLQRLGYDVETADSVRSALEVATTTRQKFDLLISDIGLPDGSGLELMQQLLERQPIKGIALSGFGMEEDVRKSKEAGFYEHLTKPINFKRLETAIRDLTDAG